MPRADYSDPPKDLLELGDALRRLRERAGLKQIELAAAAEVSESQVSEVERGKNNPGWLLLIKLLRGMDATIDDLASALGSSKLA